ncbi:MAG: AI-2E family transporter [Proteobacteria bacterium]|nr:MAG: AI-2E family transporter [Pseudomonadota bacterium]
MTQPPPLGHTARMNQSPEVPAPRLLEISWKSIAKILAAILLTSVVLKLAGLISLLVAAVLVAMTMNILVRKMENYGLKRHYGIGVILFCAIGIAAAVSFLLVPALAEQIQAFATNLPKLQASILDQLPAGKISQMARQAAARPETVVANWPAILLGYGSATLSAFSSLLVALVFSFYFLADGNRAFNWFVTFFSVPTQKKLCETGEELSVIVGQYMTAQLITSLMVGVFCGVLLTVLKVPGALMLAVFAGVADVVPVVGITIALVAATLTALSVSAESAIWVVACFLVYQLIENYLLTPIVYGARLRVSNLVVLLTLAAGGILAGAVGVLLSLPVAAAYPVVERIWLKKYLGARVVAEHQAADAEKEAP